MTDKHIKMPRKWSDVEVWIGNHTDSFLDLCVIRPKVEARYFVSLNEEEAKWLLGKIQKWLNRHNKPLDDGWNGVF